MIRPCQVLIQTLGEGRARKKQAVCTLISPQASPFSLVPEREPWPEDSSEGAVHCLSFHSIREQRVYERRGEGREWRVDSHTGRTVFYPRVFVHLRSHGELHKCERVNSDLHFNLADALPPPSTPAVPSRLHAPSCCHGVSAWTPSLPAWGTSVSSVAPSPPLCHLLRAHTLECSHESLVCLCTEFKADS